MPIFLRLQAPPEDDNKEVLAHAVAIEVVGVVEVVIIHVKVDVHALVARSLDVPNLSESQLHSRLS